MKKLLLILIAIMFIACDNATEQKSNDSNNFTIKDINGYWHWARFEDLEDTVYIDYRKLPNCILGYKELTYSTEWMPYGTVLRKDSICWRTKFVMLTRDFLHRLDATVIKYEDSVTIESEYSLKAFYSRVKL